MSGRVVSTGRVKHRCAPGWRDERAADGTWHGVMPTPWEFPEGTVWECGHHENGRMCGRRWVSRGSVYVNTPGEVFWRRERLLSRLWRAVAR